MLNPNNDRPLILANGEKFVTKIQKSGSGRSPKPPRSYEEARLLVKKEISTSLEKLAELPKRKRLDDELTLCLRLHPDVTAKTYDPHLIIDSVPDLENVGSREYRIPLDEVTKTQRIEKIEKKIKKVEGVEIMGRLVFVRGNQRAFRQLMAHLDNSENMLPEKFKTEIRRIESFDLLRNEEQVLGFDSDWKEGRVEIVLHPSAHSLGKQQDFFETLLQSNDFGSLKPRIVAYPNGPTFISCRMSEELRNALAGANPLRSVHPLEFRGFEALRVSTVFKTPLASSTKTQSTIKIGMFDGGVDISHPLLKGHVEEDNDLAIKSTPEKTYIAHGVAVAGVLLHGPLNNLSNNLELPAPPVSVVSIRVLPTSDPEDIDLYESIDVIEAAVPSRKDIKVFNLSFGPDGPFQEDQISRFTYALDSLAVKHDVSFVIATGNTAERGGIFERIQAPADLANGIAVGAFTKREGNIIHAPYSCKGPGREGAKVKPDVVAFGGCENSPIHLISHESDFKTLDCGTSFSAPITASLVAQASAGFDRGNPLLARALIIHTAENPTGKPDHSMGHGCIQPDLESLLRCESNKKVTTLFQGDIQPTEFKKLPIMLPNATVNVGDIYFSWTIAVLPAIDANHAADYTSCCIEDFFYPNSLTFNWSNPDKNAKPKVKSLTHGKNTKEIEDLEKQGWTASEFPVSKSGNNYLNERERRAMNCKWEPIVRHSAKVPASDAYNPFLVLHAIARNKFFDRMQYAAVVTIHAPECKVDLYNAVRTRYSAFTPIRLRLPNEIRIQI